MSRRRMGSPRSPVRRAAILFAAATVVAVGAGCGRHDAAATDRAGTAGNDSATATGPTAAQRNALVATPATTAEAPVAVDLPTDFPRAFPLPPGGIVTEATATRDEGSIQADAVVVSRDDPALLFAWYEQALGRAGWNIDHEAVPQAGGRGANHKLHAAHGDSEADVTVTADDEHAGWTAATLSIYWSDATGG